MNKEENRNFIRKTESLVKPKDVTAISFLGDFNKFLPKKTQDKIMEKGSRKIPYMGFIIDPYCFFLSYRIEDTEAAQALLPDAYSLTEASVFRDENKYPMIIISAFSARTSAFIGTRLEFYIIARHKETGLLSWIISDYETDTNSHDPKNGFCGYTCDPAIFTTTPYGELLIDFKNGEKNKEFSLDLDLNSGSPEKLDESLWIEGNLSVDYGGDLEDDSSKNFSLIFDPALMDEALRIPLEHINIKENSYFSNLIDYEKPVSAAVFPYSQHFIIKQDLKRQELMDGSGLSGQIAGFLSETGFKTMSGDAIKKPLYRGFLISGLVNLGIIIFLLIRQFL